MARGSQRRTGLNCHCVIVVPASPLHNWTARFAGYDVTVPSEAVHDVRSGMLRLCPRRYSAATDRYYNTIQKQAGSLAHFLEMVKPPE